MLCCSLYVLAAFKGIDLSSQQDLELALENERRLREQLEFELQASEVRYQALYETFQRQARELSLLERVRVALARQIELNMVFRSVVEAIADTFGYNYVSVYLLQGDELVLQYQVGYHQVITHIPITTAASGRVVRSGQAVLLEDVSIDPDYVEAIEGIISGLYVPLFNQGRVVGVLLIESAAYRLTPADLTFMTALSDHISMAIYRAQLYSRVNENEKRLTALLENSLDSIALVDLEGKFLYQSSAVLHVLGYTPEEMVGTNSFDYLHPEDTAKSIGLFQELLQNSASIVRTELRYRHKDGTYRWVDAIGSNALHVPGVEAIVVNYRDISERKVSEVALRQSEEQFRLLFENAPIGMALVSPAGRFVRINQAFCDTVGYTADEMLNMTFMEITHPDDLGTNLQQDTQLLNNEIPNFQMEKRYVHKSGQVVQVILSVALIRDDQNQPRHFISQVVDITGRKQTEQLSFEVAMEKERIRLLAEFIRNISHDFRTPMAVINTQLYLLRHADTPEKRIPRIEMLERQTTRLNKLVEGLLKMTRLDTSSELLFEPLDLNLLIHQVVEAVQKLIESKNLNLSLDLSPELPAIWANKIELSNALTELIENAAYYTAPDGSIHLRTYHIKATIVTEIQDTGVGIPYEEIPHIFERFYRVDKARPTDTGGTGLGLSIAQKIIQLHQGNIEVESTVGEGSIFRVLLPLKFN